MTDALVAQAADSLEFLTKGDNNQVDDRGLYGSGMKWLQPKNIIGRVRACLPYVGACMQAPALARPLTSHLSLSLSLSLCPGMVTILMNDYPQFKWLLIASLGFFVLVNRYAACDTEAATFLTVFRKLAANKVELRRRDD
jgi:signal peptidase